MNRKNIPNLITIFRFILIIPIIGCLLSKQYEEAFYLFLLAGISDGMDGFLARKFKWMSRMGAIMDPLADKALMVLSYLALGYSGNLPWWLVATVIGRDAIIILGAVIYRKIIEEPEYYSTFISKLNTLLQLSLVVFVLFDEVYKVIPPQYLTILMYVVASTTVSSLLDYIWLWGRRAYSIKRGKI